MTFTESTETFLKRFNTVEELGDAGFITDRGAVNFLKTIFDENGVNHSAEVGEVELEKQAFWDDAPLGADNNGNLVHIEDIEPDEGVNEQGPSGDVVDENPVDDKKEEPEPTPEPEQEKVNEPEHEKEPEPESTDEQGPSEEVKEPEPTPEPESAPAEKPKKTTGRKSTKKES
jgi:outer membrane biosynthesis protein TonB